MKEEVMKIIEEGSLDGGFLQSDEWKTFQESFGRKTYHVSGDCFWANIIEHRLSIVGKYFYVPRGPIVCDKRQACLPSLRSGISGQATSDKGIQGLIDLAKENNAGWIRIEPVNEEVLKAMETGTKYKIVKAPHDVQPKELFIIDIKKSEEEILSEMKAKTRYNIKLAEKRGVRITLCEKNAATWSNCVEEFLRLVEITAKRDGIISHPRQYYMKMLESIPSTILKLYVAEYNNKIVAANLIIFFGKTCTYLHGASDDDYRNVMAPYLLQWQQIRRAISAGCEQYDFGGVSGVASKENSEQNNQSTANAKWAGITRFKTGFAPKTVSVKFPGSYDIIINPLKYWLYSVIQKIKYFIK